jgi:hypothetical protein
MPAPIGRWRYFLLVGKPVDLPPALKLDATTQQSACEPAGSEPEKRRRPSYRSPVPIPPGPEPLDVSVQQAMWFGDWSPRQVFRLIAPPDHDPDKPPVVESFLFGGKRRIVFESLKRYRAVCLAKGPQLTERPVTGKRPVGRPKKLRTSPGG